VNAGPPAVAEFGLKLLMLGVGGFIVNVTAFETGSPGFTTVTLALPVFVIRLADTFTVNCIPLT
jgi:hypothetical protein